MRPRTIALVVLIAILSACSAQVGPPGQGTVYVTRADSTGWASVHLVGMGVDEPVDFTAWTAERQCAHCTPTAWVMVTEVMLLAGGTLKARAEPGEVVWFVVRWCTQRTNYVHTLPE